MKFIHCADIHLNAKTENLPLEKAKIVREENYRAFEKLCDYASNNDITAVIISGDLFDVKKVPQKAFNRVFNAVKGAKSVDFICVYGNHDENVFDSIEDDIPANFKIIKNDWSYFRYDNVVIAGVSFNKLNGSYIYDTLSLSESDVNIVSLHGQVVGYKSYSEAENVSIPRLKDKNIDYLALGHVHFYSEEELDARGKFCYSGCLNGRGFDETGDKGFVLLESLGNKLSSQFVKFSNRNFYEYEYDISGKNDWFAMRDEILRDLKVKYLENSLIKVTIIGKRTPEFEIDREGLKNYLEEYFFFAKVKDKTELDINVSDYEGDKSIKGEFIRAVMCGNLSKEEADKIITCGLNALKGVK